MDDATIGPAVQLAAHVALLPLVRVGGYLGADLSPGAGTFSARDFYSGGVRLKLMSPWPRGNVRTWLFFGFGAVGVYAPAREAGGHLFELPIGIGASYKFRKPWAFSAELGFRYGFGHGGSVYDSAYENRSDLARSTEPFQGIDRFALGLTIGVLADL